MQLRLEAFPSCTQFTHFITMPDYWPEDSPAEGSNTTLFRAPLYRNLPWFQKLKRGGLVCKCAIYIYTIGSPDKHCRVKINSCRFNIRPHWSLGSSSLTQRVEYNFRQRNPLLATTCNVAFIHDTAVQAMIQKRYVLNRENAGADFPE